MCVMPSKERKKRDKTYLRIRKADGLTDRKEYFHNLSKGCPKVMGTANISAFKNHPREIL